MDSVSRAGLVAQQSIASGRPAPGRDEAGVLLDDLFKRAPVGMGFLDRKLCYVRVNDALAEMNGLPPAAHIGRPVGELLPAHSRWPLIGLLQKVLETGEALRNFEVCGDGARAHGQKRWWLASYYPTTRRGRISGVGVAVTEITAQKQAAAALAANEERFRLLAENAVDLVYRYRLLPTPGFEYVSPSSTKMTGYTPEEHYADPDLVFKIVHPDDRPLLEASRRSLDQARELTLRWIRKDGAMVWTEQRNRPVHDADGKLIAVEGMVRDVTERKKDERDQEQAARMQELFVGVLGHDLRNPLNAITTTASVLMETDGLKVAESEAVKRIARSGRRMAVMIDQLLDFTRVRRAGGMPIERRQVDLSQICNQAAEELRASYPGRVIRVDTKGRPTGKWDADRLGQVMSNLMGNALRHGAPDKPVRVSLHGTGSVTTVEVHNHGAPIPPDILPFIFEPFRRGKNRRESPSDHASNGLGLGLYITHQIVMAHGGTLQVSSTEGRGTRFRIMLPRRP